MSKKPRYSVPHTIKATPLPTVTHYTQVMLPEEWCQLNRISPRTGRRILASGSGPAVVQISTRRFGITVASNKAGAANQRTQGRVMSTEHFDPGLKRGSREGAGSLDPSRRCTPRLKPRNQSPAGALATSCSRPGSIPSMATNEMQRVYRLLKEAREQGVIPWEWIVDETRSLERTSTWDDPEDYARCVAQSYRRDFWNQQPLGSKSGARRAPCAACLGRCSISTPSASILCTASTAPLRLTTSPRMMMAEI